MITQTINSKSKLADYKNYYKQAKQELEELRELQNNKVLTLQDYRQDFNRRLSIHDAEFALAIRDTMRGFDQAVDFLGNAKRATVQLFPIQK